MRLHAPSCNMILGIKCKVLDVEDNFLKIGYTYAY